jgi:hypothetical protein
MTVIPAEPSVERELQLLGDLAPRMLIETDPRKTANTHWQLTRILLEAPLRKDPPNRARVAGPELSRLR